MADVNALLDAALAEANAGGASLGEARFVNTEQEWITVRNADVEQNRSSTDQGVGVRVLVDGAWGFGATPVLSESAVREAVRNAVGLARANAKVQTRKVELEPIEPVQGEYRTAAGRDPFDVPLSQKLELLKEAAQAAKTHDEVKLGRAGSIGLRRTTHLKTLSGTDIEQTVVLAGGGVSATAVGNDDVQTRSWPKSHEGDVNQAGWEFVEAMDLVGNAPKLGEEARELLYAESTPEGRRTLIIDGSQMSLQIHESCGHPIELDRALGEEISLAGGSFLQPDRLGGFTYGSKNVNLYADSTSEGGPGTFGWDDEGVPASRWDIVRDGEFVGYLGSRETAAQIPNTVPGAMRSVSFSRLPIVRMVNINMEPGSHSMDDLIAETEDGVLVSVNKSWSIDDYRLNFQFSCEIGWEVKNGKITRMLKNPVYSGKTPEFWGACDAVGDRSTWQMWGWMFCGKGDPMQAIHVGHGCPAARFQNVWIGSTK